MPNNNNKMAFVVQPGMKEKVNYGGPFANRRRKRPKFDQPNNVMVDNDRVDYESSPTKPKYQSFDKGKIADEVQYKHQQFRKTGSRNKTKSDFDVEVGFGRGNSRGFGGGASMLRSKGKGTQRTIFFDETGSQPVTLESRKTTMFPDPYRTPQDKDPKVFIKSLEFNLFKYFDVNTFDNTIEFERESLFKSMLQDIRRIFSSPQYNNLTTEKLFNYFNAVALAIIEYYEIDSLMANDAYKYNDVNLGIRLLKDAAASETVLLETQYKLRRAIQGSYLPSKVFELIRWASQWYTFNEEGDSRATALKFSLGLGLKNTCEVGGNTISRRPAFTNANYVTRVNNLIADLYEQQESPGIQAAIAKAYPDWAVLDLPLSCNKPIYDQRAIDLWLNQPALLRTNTLLYVEPETENDLELATMNEQGLDLVVPSCVSVKAVLNNRTNSHLDAVLTPNFHLAQWDDTNKVWLVSFERLRVFQPQAQDPISNVCALSLNIDNQPQFKWLNNSTAQAIPDTYKMAYQNGQQRYTQFNSEVLRLKPMTEEQKIIETCDFVTRIITG